MIKCLTFLRICKPTAGSLRMSSSEPPTKAYYKSLNGSDWDSLHKINKDSISVTNLITFMGYGYKHRNALFVPTTKEKENHYEKLAMDHGHKYEPIAIKTFDKVFSRQYMCNVHTTPHTYFIPKYKMTATPDFTMLDLQDEGTDGLSGLGEIKCPYGRNYGKFEDMKGVYLTIEDNPRFYKHWIQIQLYMYLLPLFKDFAWLIYFYTYAGDNGRHVMIAEKFYRHPRFMEEFHIKDNLDSFFNDYMERTEHKREKNPYPWKLSDEEILQMIRESKAPVQITMHQE